MRAWLFLAAMAALTITLGVLQYQWLGEVSQAERERMKQALGQALLEVSQALNSHLSAEVVALVPETTAADRSDRERAYIERFLAHSQGAHGGLFESLSMVVPARGDLQLYRLDPAQRIFVPAEWPEPWLQFRRQLEARAQSQGGRFPRGGPFPPGPSNVIEVPVFDPGASMPHELEWLVIEVNEREFAADLIPTLLRRHAPDTEFDVSVSLARDPSQVIYGSQIRARDADASVRLFEFRMDRLFQRQFGGHRHDGVPGRTPPPNEPGMRPPPRGAWTLSVRHRAGSLDALVDRARQRNLGVSFGILLLISGAAAALVRYTRRAQTLADLQMEFVAGVSHELKTPLSVMRTAGHNLRGRISEDPAKVQRYGELIESESEKLRNIVEQILAFSNARAGRAMSTAEVLSVPALLEQALADEQRVIDTAGCSVEKHIDTAVPLINGDPTTLRQAFRNLLSNAAKYGGEGGWIGITAREAGDTVEIRVADRGRGIESEDDEHIFDPFYRGRGAIDEQIHGTGLGLSLAKRIVEAHRGSIAVDSRPGHGAEFIVRLPSTGHYDDFAHTAG